MADLHCYHVVFGASSDNGYARLLGPYSSDEKNSKRVTMLVGPPLAKELAELAGKLSVMSTPNIFRSTKIPTRRVSFSHTPPSTPTLDYASVAATRPAEISPMLSTAGSTRQSVGRVFRNGNGQRVDVPLRVSASDVTNIKAKKLCNSYHIAGSCKHEKCLHEHGTRLSGKPLEALRHIARMCPCSFGLDCDYEDCIMGHRCTKDPGGLGAKCWFPSVMHGVDMRIV